MRVIILGVGQVGTYLGGDLSKAGHNVVVIDLNRDNLASLGEICDVQTITGNAADISVLEKANVRECDLFLAVTNNDEVNMLSCLLAKNLASLTAIARLRKSFYFQGSKTFYRNKLGIDMIVCPEILAALEIVSHTGEAKSTVVETLADGHIEVKAFTVTEQFKYKNSVLNEIPFPKTALVSAVVRDDKLIIPGGNEKILEHDELYIIGKTETIENIDNFFNGKTKGWFFHKKTHKTAFVLGGDKIGAMVSKMLSLRDISVKLIEKDAQKCKILADELPDVAVFCHDGTSHQFLHEEKIESADYFIATCKHDETNLLGALLARDVGVKNVITVVNRKEYKPTLKRLGLNKLINPQNLTARSILEFIKNGNMLSHSLKGLEEADILEIYTNDNFPLDQMYLKEIKLPSNTLICSILRGDDIFIPRGGDKLSAGDIIVIFTLRENVNSIRKLFLGL